MKDLRMPLNKKTCALLRNMRHPAPSSKIQLFFVTGNDYQLPAALTGLIKQRVAQVTPFLMDDRQYTPMQLLGSDLWSALNAAETRMVELAINEMAQRGEIALAAAGRSSNGAANFVLVTR
jgi:hypothetical protein